MVLKAYLSTWLIFYWVMTCEKDANIHLLAEKSAKVRAKPLEKDFEISAVAANSTENRDRSIDGENLSEDIPVLSWLGINLAELSWSIFGWAVAWIVYLGHIVLGW
ncbi:hypothetical protein OIU79_010168 [Salix purpurea]|uniref:Uncharacterized protein n=1 Tax=Salix purpurea TaxID=77065 RepID=A0A9Q0QFI9_SALPP|nr:hypothetical protein OIU79_010168 [Salix purpurea]